ncbi:hypothetical protein [Bacillus sp. AK031]
MGFLDKIKEQVKADLNNAKEQANKNSEDRKRAIKAGRTKEIRLDYIGGHPTIKPKQVSIRQGADPKVLKIGLVTLNVKKVEWDEKGKRSAGKAAAGAIIGGVATGGLGLIAGAAIGGRKKDTSCTIMTVEDDGIEYTLYFRTNGKEYSKLVSMI